MNPDEEEVEIGGPPRGAMMLDPIEIVGRRNAPITLDEIAIEGDPDAPIDPLGDVRARVLDEAAPPSEDPVADFFASLPERARDVPVVGDWLGDWLETGTAPASGAADMATYGFGDELAGGAAAVMRDPSVIGRILAGLGPGPSAEAYTDTRDRVRTRMARDQAEHPAAYATGGALGALATAPLIPTTIPGGATTLARLGRAGLEGAALGGLSGAGHSEADVGSLDMGRDTLEGAAIGGGAGVLGGALAEGISAAAPVVRRLADEWRVASTGAGARETRDLLEELGGGGADALGEAARRIRGSGLVPAIGTTSDVADRALRELTEGGVSDAERSIASARVPRATIADALDTAAARGALSPADAPAMSRVRDYAARVRTPAGPSEVMPGPLTEEAATTLPFSAPGRPAGTAMHELDAMDRGAAWARPGEVTPPSTAYRDARRSVRDALDELFRTERGDEGLSAYRAARSRASVAAPIHDAAVMGSSRSAGSRVGGLMDALVAGVGGGAAHALGGDTASGMAAGYLANRALHNYGRTARATVGDALAGAVESAARRGPRGTATSSRDASALARTLREALRDRPAEAPGIVETPLASDAPTSDDDFGFMPDEPAEDDFGFTPDEGEDR